MNYINIRNFQWWVEKKTPPSGHHCWPGRFTWNGKDSSTGGWLGQGVWIFWNLWRLVKKTGWWQLTYFWNLGEMILFDEHIFQMGWNHQLENHWGSGHLLVTFFEGRFFLGGEKNEMLQLQIFQVDENDEMPHKTTWEAILDQHCLLWFSAYSVFGYLPNPKAKHREGCEHVSQNGFPIRLTKKPKRCCFFPSLKQFSARVVLEMDGLKFLSYFQGCWLLVGGFTASVGQSLLFVTSHPCGEVPTAYSAVSSDDSVVSLLQALRLGSSRDVTLCDLGFVGSVRLTFFGSTTCRPVGFLFFSSWERRCKRERIPHLSQFDGGKIFGRRTSAF